VRCITDVFIAKARLQEKFQHIVKNILGIPISAKGIGEDIYMDN